MTGLRSRTSRRSTCSSSSSSGGPSGRLSVNIVPRRHMSLEPCADCNTEKMVISCYSGQGGNDRLTSSIFHIVPHLSYNDTRAMKHTTHQLEILEYIGSFAISIPFAKLKNRKKGGREENKMLTPIPLPSLISSARIRLVRHPIDHNRYSWRSLSLFSPVRGRSGQRRLLLLLLVASVSSIPSLSLLLVPPSTTHVHLHVRDRLGVFFPDHREQIFGEFFGGD
jgi:hypothetical protein